jgi:hypothetical protein
VGTVALKKEGDYLYELCKMAVDENFRGHHAGLILGEAALQKARSLGAKKVVLYSQTTFNNGIAINLYKKMGFKEVELEKGGYERCNIKMVYDFETGEYLKQMANWIRNVVTVSYHKLQLISPKEWEKKASVVKWSKKELIGHLIDSASNNHQRFVRAQYTDSLSFPRYHQNEWVDLQNYHHQPYEELAAFWYQYNLRLAGVIENIHPEKLETICRIGDNDPVTLHLLVEDYVYHVIHHLKQVDPSMTFDDPGIATTNSTYRQKFISELAG